VSGGNRIQTGDDARAELDQQKRQTTSRRELAKHQGFDDVSPGLGELDTQAFEKALGDNADEALGMLADLTGATDKVLREQAKRLAGRLVIDVARSGPVHTRGVGRLRNAPATDAMGDLDLDASLEPLLIARATGTTPALDDLRVTEWARPDTALSLVVDRSGSMGGARLAAAAVAAAACSWRAPNDWSLLAFSSSVIVIKDQTTFRSPGDIVDDIFCLRGHGTTDVALALKASRDLLATSRAKRRLTILLSDGRPTTGEDPVDIARTLDELCIIAPAEDCEDAAELADAVGARWVPLVGPAGVPAAFQSVFDR